MSVHRPSFPNLRDEDFQATSAVNDLYNCIAWAAGVDDEWWEPSTDGVWPNDVPKDPTVENLSLVYQGLGYSECDNQDLEPGYEKIAIYGTAYEYEHAARQLPDGKWTSKLGPDDDICHVNLECLAGQLYGQVMRILRRQISEAPT